MTQWGLDNLFNPGKRHMDDEKRRLQATREEVGDASGGRRIDLESGRVSIVPRPASAAEEAEPTTDRDAHADLDAGAPDELDEGGPADEDAITPDQRETGQPAVETETPEPPARSADPADSAGRADRADRADRAGRADPADQGAGAAESPSQGATTSRRSSAAAWARRG